MSFLYQRIAENLETAILKGIYLPGTRLPSIRKTSQQEKVSIATVSEAFARLETQGLIEARPKSGYFVCHFNVGNDEPGTSSPPNRPEAVSISRIVLHLSGVAREQGMVSLSLATPDEKILVSAEFSKFHSRAARMSEKGINRYEAPAGTESLRKAISLLKAGSGSLLSDDEIIITNGAQEALILSLRALTKPGDVIVVESPTYYGVLQAIEACGLRALELPTNPRTGISIDVLEQLAARGSIDVCVLAPNFQNPLGFEMTIGAKQDVVDIMSRYKIPLIEDDVYTALSGRSEDPRSLLSFDTTGNTIQCGSFSKTVSPALRIGWVAPGKFYDDVLQQKFLTNMSSEKVGQLAMADFLDSNRYKKSTLAAARIYKSRLKILRQSVFEYFPKGTRCTLPRGGYLLWVEMPKANDSMNLFDRARAENLTFLPGQLFTQTANYRNCLRLSVGNTSGEQIPAIVERLGSMI